MNDKKRNIEVGLENTSLKNRVIRLSFIILILTATYNVKGQNISMQTVIETVFCDSSNTFSHESIYIVKNSADSFFNYNSNIPKCVDLVVCSSQEELLKILRKEKEIYLLTFEAVDSNKSDENEYVFTLNTVLLKGNRKEIKLLLYEDSYHVYFRMNAQTKKWEIYKIKYPRKFESIRKL